MILRASRVSKKVQASIFRCFVKDLTAAQASYHYRTQPDGTRRKVKGVLDVSRPCVNRYYRHYREAIYAATSRAPRFEGEVEVDIGFFAGRASKHTSALVRRLAGLEPGRIVAKRKTIKKEKEKSQMVLGFLRRQGDIYLLPIKSKSRLQLESAVRLVVAPGTIIYTDMEKGLANIKLNGYTHHPINHALGYVDQQGNHINGIESFWRGCRQAMSRNFRGIPRSTLLLHVKEREFRYNHRHDLEQALKALLKHKNP